MIPAASVEPGYAILADLDKPLDFPAIFGNHNPVDLEIGAGRGDFAIGYGGENPDINILAVERKANYLKRGVNKARQQGIGNIRFLNVEINHLLAEYVPADSLSSVHIYFPDPWPKKRHKKRRIVQLGMIKQLSRKLKLGGLLHLRTDHADYFASMMEVMCEQQWFTPVEVPAEISKHQTGFERRFRADGLPIYLASYRLSDKHDENNAGRE